jgi:hypothetical protein
VSPAVPLALALDGVPIPCPCQALLGDPESTCGLWIVTVDDFTTAHPSREVAEIVAQIAAATSPVEFEPPC